MLKKQFLVCLIAIFGFLHTGQALSATVSLVPSSGAVTVGDTLTLDVLLTGVIPGDVAGFDMDILYDPVLFGTPGAAYGTSLGGPLDSLTDEIHFPGGVSIFEPDRRAPSDRLYFSGIPVLSVDYGRCWRLQYWRYYNF